jgi:hypothetical protein
MVFPSKNNKMVFSSKNNKMVLLFIDSLEEFRYLSLQEWNFWVLVQENIEDLFEQQRFY